jgi:hypothetical protein
MDPYLAANIDVIDAVETAIGIFNESPDRPMTVDEFCDQFGCSHQLGTVVFDMLERFTIIWPHGHGYVRGPAWRRPVR